MKNKEMEDKIGIIFKSLMYLYPILLEACQEPGAIQENCDKTIKAMIKHLFEAEEGLYEYALEAVPLAQENGVYEWVFNSVEMYKETILEQLAKRKEQ